MNDDNSDCGRNAEANNGINQRLRDNDLVNVVVGSTHRAKGGKLIEVIFGAGIERLRDDGGSDNDTEQCACKERCTRSRFKEPERATLFAELIRGECLNAWDFGTYILANPVRHSLLGQLERGND